MKKGGGFVLKKEVALILQATSGDTSLDYRFKTRKQIK
jgi:hypothetical protein